MMIVMVIEGVVVMVTKADIVMMMTWEGLNCNRWSLKVLMKMIIVCAVLDREVC
jgi:hypothetical protein